MGSGRVLLIAVELSEFDECGFLVAESLRIGC